MKYVGKIDIAKFNGLFSNVITDEVVLTEKQELHINKRHPTVLETYFKHSEEILYNPDYIFQDNSKENTILLLKTFINEKYRNCKHSNKASCGKGIHIQ